ncbi:MAG: 30S ribosomal protein S20 [Candidatus Eisenbacteria bacterium]|uniref:Small ribosomal subunit protein bS20 n=1 Tax=Eiseniibacteriota bacterium TaxID=2212470 RepID=A0A849T1N7_UNCEI|nr:30S ribosomal protein S20 [Candidatus Eisenbacteria bacterium]
MPYHKSAAKRVKTNEISRRRNIAARSRMRHVLKAVREAKDRATASELYVKAAAILDRTAAKGIIKKETANRQKSRLAKFAASLSA